MIKKFFVVILVVAIGVGIWVAFALWTGIYSVYSYPPGAEYPEGATLLVSRDAGEPIFNSPDVPKATTKPPSKPGGGIGFAPMHKPRRPISIRIIVKLPYIEWAYQRSLEQSEKPEL